MVYTDFEDAIGETTEVDLPLVASAVDFDRFRAKAKVFLRAHEDRLALHKLAQPAPDGTPTCRAGSPAARGGRHRWRHRACAHAAHQPAGVCPSLVAGSRSCGSGLQRTWSSSGTATASQLQFIEEIVQHLTEHGAMPPRAYTNRRSPTSHPWPGWVLIRPKWRCFGSRWTLENAVPGSCRFQAKIQLVPKSLAAA